MSKTINTILNLKDNMSKGLYRVAKNTEGVTKEMASATYRATQFGKKTGEAITNVTKKTLKWGAVTATAIGTLAAKTGLSEAMDLEGYRLQLETATKDTQKASQIMQDAITLANKTPFEGGELVEGAAKFESMGMSASEWLSRAGDMAAATNKSFDQAVEALTDAQTGELQSLKKFGITKAKVLEQGEKMFTGVQIANNSGQIVNQEKFNEALIALMEDSFAGGMEKQATTLKGVWSTVTGVTKSSLATIVGISSDGKIKAGSALELLKDKATLLSNKLQQWQQDGTIDRLATQFSEKLAKGIDLASKAGQWVLDHGDTIKGILAGVGTAIGSIKILKFASDTASTVKTAALFGKTLLTLVGTGGPVGLVIAGIVGVSAVVGLLAANWDTVKEKAGAALDWIKEKLDAAKNWWGNSALGKGVSAITGWFKGGGSGNSGSSLPGNATGTSYFGGGWTRVNERGGEIVNLPNGSKIIPHDISRQMNGPSISVHVVVQGNVIGNEAYADQLGNTIVQRILRALDNV